MKELTPQDKMNFCWKHGYTIVPTLKLTKRTDNIQLVVKKGRVIKKTLEGWYNNKNFSQRVYEAYDNIYKALIKRNQKT